MHGLQKEVGWRAQIVSSVCVYARCSLVGQKGQQNRAKNPAHQRWWTLMAGVQGTFA